MTEGIFKPWVYFFLPQFFFTIAIRSNCYYFLWKRYELSWCLFTNIRYWVVNTLLPALIIKIAQVYEVGDFLTACRMRAWFFGCISILKKTGVRKSCFRAEYSAGTTKPEVLSPLPPNSHCLVMCPRPHHVTSNQKCVMIPLFETSCLSILSLVWSGREGCGGKTEE